MTERQKKLMDELNRIVNEFGETCGFHGSLHTDLREFAHKLKWYFEERVLEEVK